RLQLDLRELLKRGNGLFGSAEQTGSVGVVTLNCARLGYLHAGDEIGMYQRLDELLGYARESLEVKRKVIQRLIDQGLFPYSKRWPDILQAGTTQMPYYTNSSQLPVGFTDDPFEALARQEPLQSKYTGGTVLHLYMSERVSSAHACKALVRRSLANFRVPYIT